MNIDVRIRKLVDNGNRLKAHLSITIDEKLAIHDVRLLQRNDGSFFVSKPSRKDENDAFRDIVHPIGNEVRQELEIAVVQAYHDYLDANPPKSV